MEIELRLAALTVNTVLPVAPPNDAEMVEVPTFVDVASPLTVMPAILDDELQ